MATLSWKDLSEIVAGKVIQHKLSESAIRADWLMPPYNTLVQKAQNAKKRLSDEQVVEILGIPAYQTALDAARATRDLPEAWAGLLESAARNHELGMLMEKAGRRLLSGEAMDLSKVKSALDGATEASEFTILNLADIEIPKEYDAFTKSGYEPFDTHIGGWPDPGLVVIAAPPGTGKTFMALEAMGSYASIGKHSLFFSIEQSSLQIAHRCRTIMKMPKSVQKLIDIYDAPIGVSEVISIVTQLEDVDMVVIDFAELLVEGDDQVSSEQLMTSIYRRLAKLAKKKNIVIVLLAQFNRANYTQMSFSSIRYSGAAEQMASMILFLYNPSQMYVGLGTESNGHITLDQGNGAVLVVKSRHGFKYGFPIAIEIPWTNRGWAKKSVRYHQINSG